MNQFLDWLQTNLGQPELLDAGKRAILSNVMSIFGAVAIPFIVCKVLKPGLRVAKFVAWTAPIAVVAFSKGIALLAVDRATKQPELSELAKQIITKLKAGPIEILGFSDFVCGDLHVNTNDKDDATVIEIRGMDLTDENKGGLKKFERVAIYNTCREIRKLRQELQVKDAMHEAKKMLHGVQV